MTLSAVWNITDSLSGHMNLLCHTRWWDYEILRCYAHGCVDFIASSMASACIKMLISIHESSGSWVKYLCVVSP